MISYELKPPSGEGLPDELEIFLDEEGLKKLLSQLKFLEDGQTDHVHLMSESWGGYELSDRVVGSGNSLIHHVKIYKS